MYFFLKSGWHICVVQVGWYIRVKFLISKALINAVDCFLSHGDDCINITFR